jgi:serine/threonine protein kinase
MLESLKEMFKSKKDGAPVLGGRIDINDRFLLGEKTSQGSMSRVYKAIDRQRDQTVCLKIQLREKCEAAAERSSKDKPNEGQIGYQIHHPHVVQTLDWGYTTDDELFIELEYVDGVSLDYVRKSIKLGLRGKLKVLAQAAEGLAAIHAAGFIHHDINPGNVLINRENQVKIIDFGLAVPNTASFHKPGNRTGALPYMAPELIRREVTDHRLDIFAFGALAFEFLTNRLPYEPTGGNSMAMMLQRINQAPIDPAEANPRLSEEVCVILRKALARREERWTSMADMAKALAVAPAKREAESDSAA